MRILKSNPVLTIFNSYLVDSPQPSTLSYLWNFGSLLGLCLISQIVSGILLAMHYQGSASFAFASVEHVFISYIFICAFFPNLSLIIFYYSSRSALQTEGIIHPLPHDTKGARSKKNYSRQDAFFNNRFIPDLKKKIPNIDNMNFYE
jgi:hypothetical protein